MDIPSKISELLAEFPVLTTLPVSLPPKRQCDHEIPLVEGTRPVSVRPYRGGLYVTAWNNSAQHVAIQLTSSPGTKERWFLVILCGLQIPEQLDYKDCLTQQSLLAKLTINPTSDPSFKLHQGLLRYKGRIWVGNDSPVGGILVFQHLTNASLIVCMV